jgi:hypothetical protein
MVLLAGMGTHLIDQRLSLVFIAVWIFLFIRQTRERFQTTAPSADATVAPAADATAADAPDAADAADVTVAPVSDADFNIYLQIQNDKQTYQLKINKNNTFNDILSRMELKLNKIDMLRDHIIGFDIVSENNTTIKYFVDTVDLSLTIQRWNVDSKTKNKNAQKIVNELSEREEGKSVADIKTEYCDKHSLEPDACAKYWDKLIHRNTYKLPIIGENSRLILYKRTNLDRLVFIFKNLTLISDKNDIIGILAKENITMPSELTNFNTQKYTAKGNIQVINYRDIENIITFSLMFPIYGFTDLRIIELIKKNQNIKSFLKDKLIENLLKNKDSLRSIEQTGLEFYMKKKTIHPKYYKLLNVIGINDLFAIEDMYDFSINEPNYGVEDIKEINYICVQFIINGVITHDEIIDTTDTWKIKVITRIAKNYNKFFDVNDDIFNKYELKRRFTEQLYKNKLELNTQLNIDFNMINLSNSAADKKEYQKNIYEIGINKQKKIEFKKLAEINNKVFAYEQQKNKNQEAIEIGKIEKEFATVSLDIVNDFANLFTNPSDERYMNYVSDGNTTRGPDGNIIHGPEDESQPGYRPDMAKYVFYFKEIVKIVTKDGRMFYEGIAILVVAILLFFIESSK